MSCWSLFSESMILMALDLDPSD
uniref:Uncharacterized protein n=1 Tax=Rhizophora mucronata TaxID=61149 RepID=A0A2P2NEB3_RHIMU